jgi:hypothetical protein
MGAFRHRERADPINPLIADLSGVRQGMRRGDSAGGHRCVLIAFATAGGRSRLKRIHGLF